MDSDIGSQEIDCCVEKFFGTTQLVIIQPTSFCNLDCSYCYLSNRKIKSKMARAVVEGISRNLCSSLLLHKELEFSFHSGEPLAVGKDWFLEALELLDSSWSADTKVVYSVQTNATLIDDDWVEIFKRYNFRVSISLDGPRDLNDANRKNWSGNGSFSKVISGVERLAANNVPFALLCVLNNINIGSPNELFQFFDSLKPRVVAFNVEEIEGMNNSSSICSSGHRTKLEKFYRTYLNLCVQNNFPHELREFRQMKKFISLGLKAKSIKSDESTPFRIIHVDSVGLFTTFSPELADMVDQKNKSFTLGNILNGKPEETLDKSRLIELSTLINCGVELCRDHCEYFSVCGGGAPANKLSEKGTFFVSETNHCKNSVKLVADVVADQLLEHPTERVGIG